MGHIVNPNLFRLNYVISWSNAMVSKKKFSSYFDTRNILVNDFIDAFFKKYKNISKYMLYLLFFKIIYINNTFVLFFIFKQHKNFFKKKLKKILIKKTAKNSLFFNNKNFTTKYSFFKKNSFSVMSNLNSVNIFLNKIRDNVLQKNMITITNALLKPTVKKNPSNKKEIFFCKKLNKGLPFRKIKRAYNSKFFKIINNFPQKIQFAINKRLILYVKESRNYKFKQYCNIVFSKKKIRLKFKHRYFYETKFLSHKVFQKKINIKLKKVSKKKISFINKRSALLLKSRFSLNQKIDDIDLITKTRFFMKKQKLPSFPNLSYASSKGVFKKNFYVFTNLFEKKHSEKKYFFNNNNIKKFVSLKFNSVVKITNFEFKHLTPIFLEGYKSLRYKYKLIKAFNSIKSKKRKAQFYRTYIKYADLKLDEYLERSPILENKKFKKNKIKLTKSLFKKLVKSVDFKKDSKLDFVKKKLWDLSKIKKNLKLNEDYYPIVIVNNIFKHFLKVLIEKKSFKSKNRFKTFKKKSRVDANFKSILNEKCIKDLFRCKILKKRYKTKSIKSEHEFQEENEIRRNYNLKYLSKNFLSKIFLFEQYSKVLSLKKRFINFFIILYPKLDINIFIIIKSFWSAYVTSDMIAEYFILRLLQKRLVVEIMKPMIKFLNKSIKKKKIYGYAILLMGRFTRKDRATYKWYKKGPFTKSNRIVNIDYASRRVSLKFSTCSFKINLIKTIGYKNL